MIGRLRVSAEGGMRQVSFEPERVRGDSSNPFASFRRQNLVSCSRAHNFSLKKV